MLGLLLSRQDVYMKKTTRHNDDERGCRIVHLYCTYASNGDDCNSSSVLSSTGGGGWTKLGIFCHVWLLGGGAVARQNTAYFGMYNVYGYVLMNS